MIADDTKKPTIIHLVEIKPGMTEKERREVAVKLASALLESDTA